MARAFARNPWSVSTARASSAVLTVVALAAPAFAQPSLAPDPAAEARREDALSHFQLGLSHFDREEWAAALVEFLRSREILPTRGNTKNAAICLRKVGRFDESLDLFEALLRDYADLSPTDRALADREVPELRASVGTVEVRDAPDGATVTIDSLERGKTPLRGPVRLSAGRHTVRLVTEGALPFEALVDLAGKQALVVHARMAALTQAGRLRVSATGGKSLEVIVDGAVVGKTPWEGAVAPGPHTVASRGEGRTGTAPSSVVVALDQVEAVELVARELHAALRVAVRPASAEIEIDGVPVGRGQWDGGLASGAHRISASLDGYLPFARSLLLDDDQSEVVTVVLQPPQAGRSGLVFEADLGAPFGLVWGGDLASGCSAGCSAPLPVGFQGLARAAYQAPSGIGVGVHAGYLVEREGLGGRPDTITPVGLPPRHGTSSDVVWLSGLRVGADAQYVTAGRAWPVTLRLALGALIGSAKDDRTGSGFTDSTGAPFAVAASQASAADYLYVGPEARIGRRFGDHLEVNVGVEVLFLAAVHTPAWSAGAPEVGAGADGEGVFPGASLTGGLLLFATPGVGVKYEP